MKEFFVLPVPASTLCKIALEGGGEVPDVLKGSYTAPAYALRDINAYLAAKDIAPPVEGIRVADVNKTIEKSGKSPSHVAKE